MDRIHSGERPPPTAKLLGLLSPPAFEAATSNGSQLELSESDVVWYSTESATPYSPLASPSMSSAASASNSPTYHHHHVQNYNHSQLHPDRQFRTQKHGLSAVLMEENPPLVRRRAEVTRSPSIAASTAVRSIPRSSPSSDGSVGSAPGRFNFNNMSAPVNIPVWDKMRRLKKFEEVEDGEEEEEDEVEMLPPHEVVAARSQTMTFSVFEGVGRTLKGRDLRRVRNAVFQQTGFLD